MDVMVLHVVALRHVEMFAMVMRAMLAHVIVVALEVLNKQVFNLIG